MARETRRQKSIALKKYKNTEMLYKTRRQKSIEIL